MLKPQKIIYSLTLLVTASTIWLLLYNAQFLDYDDNYGNIITAFFLSVLATVLIIVMWFNWRYIIKTVKWQTVLFLVFCSPITVGIVIYYYSKIFGAMLKN